MLNPITNNRKNILLYSLVWVVILAAHYFLFSLGNNLSHGIIIADSLIQISFLYALGIGIWHITVAQKTDNAFAPERWVGIFITGIVIVILWQIFAGGITWLISSKSEEYITAFKTALPYRLMFGLFTYLTLTIVYHNIIVFQEFTERKLREEKLRSSIAEQELNMLHSQINPHFLFNSLNSISALTMSDPFKAYDMTIKLSDFLRFSIKTRDKQIHSLKEELNVCNRYMDIEKVRFGEKIHYRQTLLPECEDAQVPRLIIQPLLENALKHGAYETTGSCDIEVLCSTLGSDLLIKVKNSYDAGAVQPKKGRGVGLSNIRKRLELMYDRHAGMQINKTDQLFEVNIHIPLSANHDTEKH